MILARLVLEEAAKELEQRLANRRHALEAYIQKETTEIEVMQNAVAELWLQARQSGAEVMSPKATTGDQDNARGSKSLLIRSTAKLILKLNGGAMERSSLTARLADLNLSSRDPGQLIRRALSRDPDITLAGDLYELRKQD